MTTASREVDLRYPIGPNVRRETLSATERGTAIDEIADTPRLLRSAVANMSEAQLDTPYRPGGWTVRQLVHHVVDSHVNAYTRFRLALTEDNPRIKPYDEARWAELEDARTMPVDVSLNLLDVLHQRWVVLLRSMKSADFGRTLDHPENGPMTLDTMLNLYHWHGKHHTAHVTSLRERMQWQ
jgi:uncharacterized damage-inducible protein DinB